MQPQASVASASLEIRGVRFTCTAPTNWPPLHMNFFNGSFCWSLTANVTLLKTIIWKWCSSSSFAFVIQVRNDISVDKKISVF